MVMCQLHNLFPKKFETSVLKGILLFLTIDLRLS